MVKWTRNGNNYIHAFFSKGAKAKSKEQNKGPWEPQLDEITRLAVVENSPRLITI